MGSPTFASTRLICCITPVMVAVVLFIALPVKTWACLSMNRQGWLTRTDARRVMGQAEIVTSSPLESSGPHAGSRAEQR